MAGDAAEPRPDGGRTSSLESAVVVMRCAECGDNFPTGEPGDPVCPSCGSSGVDPAWEPLL